MTTVTSMAAVPTPSTLAEGVALTIAGAGWPDALPWPASSSWVPYMVAVVSIDEVVNMQVRITKLPECPVVVAIIP